MGICRILSLVGSTSCIAILVYFTTKQGLPNNPKEWWITVSIALLVFNFVPLVSADKDSLIGLWIEAKKSKLRKQVD